MANIFLYTTFRILASFARIKVSTKLSNKTRFPETFITILILIVDALDVAVVIEMKQ